MTPLTVGERSVAYKGAMPSNTGKRVSDKGFSLDDLEIYVNGNQLTIKGERRPPQNNGGTWHRQERDYGKFTRMIELPGELNGDKVSAEFKNGVLMITLPKSEAVKPRRIEVKVT